MTRKNKSRSKHNKSNLVVKIGITFIIPIFLAITGGVIMLSVGWNYITKGNVVYNLLFSKPQKVNEYKRQVIKLNNQDVYLPYIGEQIGILKIDSVNLKQPIYEGDSDQVLAKGIAHSELCALPGENGNVVLAAHRDDKEVGFAALEYIKLGDEVSIETSYGTFYYKVSDIYITEPDDEKPGQTSNHEKLTMYTCYPFQYLGHAPQRYIVVCDYMRVED